MPTVPLTGFPYSQVGLLTTETFFSYFGGASSTGEDRFVSLPTRVGKSAGHQLVWPADLPTKLSSLANGTYRIGISREMLPAQYSRSCRILVALKIAHPLGSSRFSANQRESTQKERKLWFRRDVISLKYRRSRVARRFFTRPSTEKSAWKNLTSGRYVL